MSGERIRQMAEDLAAVSDETVEKMLSEKREGCCAQYRKPCGYHEGMADGVEALLLVVEGGAQ